MSIKPQALFRPIAASFLAIAFLLSGTAMAAESTTVAPEVNKVTAAPTTGTNTRPENEYEIQPGDILDVSVWKEKDLQKDVLVRPDGQINFPLLGSVVAAGKSVEQLRSELTTKLAKYVPDPSVSVALKQTQGYKIYIIGKVTRPGEYVTNRNMDVMQALSLAGSPTPFASVNNIKILRRDENGKLRAIPFKYSKVEKGKDLDQNIILHSGDVVVVP